MRPHLIISSLALAAATGTVSAQEACSTYEIQRGDSLRELAIQVYSTEDFGIIFDANRDVIGNNPNVIRVGDVLTLPCLEDVGRAPTPPATEAEAMAAEMASELVKAAEERAAKAIAEAEARVAAAEAEAEQASQEAVLEAKAAARQEIEAARAEAAALIRDADESEQPEIRDRQLLLITGGNYAPFTDEALPHRGLYTNLVETAMLRAAPEQGYKIQFVNDWSSHLDLLMPTLAFDATFPWSQPNCDEPAALSETDRNRCETYDFSNPFYEVVDTYFAREGSGYEQTLTYADFAGTTICRPEGWTLSHMDAVGLYEPAISLLRPVSPDDCFHAVMEGRADIVAIEAHLAVEAISRLGYEHRIIENPNLAAIKSLNVMTHKDNPDGEAILETLNQGLAIMQQSGEWRDIVSSALRYQMENG
ncbi:MULTISPECIES: transporter substrate-binding domain-containing protein [unclassified Ruegeria]|uniref:transporter substrate-binding domain-containing protein n=1 Tax=unclassified Ruegeria TaxID=2625375 RepID=UPI001ADA6A42|nr:MULTISPECIES: transporter substrate-binding domain-containing protein [unclassified Ruegeria]MBO9412485.1 transporter substrate-binding domain-containing protein [Ruegeria sp. R8_1]MBO9416277.1 transporter substrate-binding domain-containing protein [Ruegeria sp. R8_2]